ncbi:MAG: VPLPA-CTERM-specific exosortase XrtD [Desulfomicrobium sp.]|nr:VPLPA-CTERM-specific exosortase XrtD [Pseudomonadota bacterium]MBV1710449.1 VPLPA-CTERM-specific exosortase XrtD [Desulfomicrobium sp.]MBU4570070.1 VPLPA-CTERM-specific exosortase XrtD [Pseudomonadota bacterium]MBU4593988.1 VPLPA-CTERM-specific exosortase XrtD [Pseudomonadota bacterium]MBV1721121.1 VPLPA-CTERM-specific exosortase XrtD [Desulfomicrobium sp.]
MHASSSPVAPIIPRPLLLLSLLALALAAWGWLYRTYLPMLVGSWQGEDHSYAWFVPAVVVWLGWTLRERLRRLADERYSAAALWLVAAAVLFVAGKFGSIKMLVFASIWASLVAFTGFLVGNGGLKALRMPVIVALFAIPLPPFLYNNISFQLRLLSSALAEWMLRLAGVPVFREGNIIDLGLITLDVVDACSGLRYLIPTLLMALLVGWMFLGRNRLRLVLFLLAFPISIFANAFRIMLTGVLARLLGPTVAEGFFHDFSSWLVYVVALVVLFAGCRLLAIWDREQNTIPAREKAAPTLPRPHPAGLFVAGLCLFALSFMSAAGSASLPPRASFAAFPLELGPWEGSRLTLEPEVQRSLGASDYVHATFRNIESGNPLYLLVSWYAAQDGTNSAHAPTSCMLGSGWSVTGRSNLPPRDGVRDFPVGRILLEKGGNRIVANYWFEQRGRAVTNEFLNKWLLLWDALTLGRTDGALVRVEVLLRPGQSVDDGQNLVDDMVSRIVPLLPDYVPGRDGGNKG